MTTPPDFRLDQLDPIGTLDGTELMYFVQGGSSLRGTLAEVAAYGGSGTVTSITFGAGLSGGTITTSGTVAFNIGALTEDTTPDVTGDYVITLDVSGSPDVPKKVKLNKLSAGKQTIWMPASAMTPNTTNGAAAGTAEMSSNKNMIVTLDFDQTTQEFAQFSIALPKGWNLGTITFVPYWSHVAPSSPDTTGVAWGLDAVAVSDGDALDAAFGTAGVVTDTGASTNVQYTGDESSAITIAGTPAVGDMVYFRIHRDVANGSDNLTADARLHGIKLFYTTSASTDD